MEIRNQVNNSAWKKIAFSGRKSDLLIAVVLILVFISFEFSDRSKVETIRHVLAACGFVWMYMRYLKPADYSVDLLSDALKKHGDGITAGTDPLAAAEKAAARLDHLAAEVARLQQERQLMKDQRLIELAKMHQDLLTHHRSTKKMLGSFRTEEVFTESTSAGALMLAERIRTEIIKHDFLSQVHGEARLTVSIGIYTAEEGAATEDQLVRYADEAAYGAKKAGKNRVVVKTHA